MQNSFHWFFWLFLTLYLLHFTTEIALDWLNLRNIEKNRNQIPELYKNSFTPEEYQKSIAYTRAKTHFGWVKAAFDALVLWAFILTGAFERLNVALNTWFPQASLAHSIAYVAVLGLGAYVIGLPFKIYFQFVLEQKFGFNRSKAGTFLGDQLKSLGLALVIGVPLLALIFWVVAATGQNWWLLAWAIVLAFQFLTAALFPVVFAPLFYKFQALPDGSLKDQLIALAQKVKFKMAGIFTIDGSKRSNHSNAFFAGIGKTRRIVLFDTLVTSLTTPEIVAVIAHEMGHNKKRHIQKSLVLSALSSLLSFYVLALCLKWPAFFQAFGVPQPNIAIGFVLFGLVSSVFTFPFSPIFQWISRKNEYEADQFSVEQNGDSEAMIGSLVKLSKDNLSNLTPHPWYSFYHYSHPTTTERVKAIRELA